MRCLYNLRKSLNRTLKQGEFLRTVPPERHLGVEHEPNIEREWVQSRVVAFDDARPLKTALGERATRSERAWLVSRPSA